MHAFFIALGIATLSAACAPTRTSPAPDAVDPDFAALQARGEVAMGVDQYTSTHRFDSLADGGRIEFRSDTDAPRDVEQIRLHLQEIVTAFAGGDFSKPAFIHAQEVPGSRVMAEKRQLIRYTYRELPRGGEVRLTTRDPDALEAIHRFMAFQRSDHRASGEAHAH